MTRTALADSGTADVHQIPDNRCPMCVGILANATDEGADGTPVESANDHLEHGGHFFGCSKYRLPRSSVRENIECSHVTADAPPEPTEEMYKAAFDAWMEWLKAGRGTGLASVRIAVQAALAAAQPDTVTQEEG